MTFTIWDYLVPTAGVYLAGFILVMLICAFYLAVKPKAAHPYSPVVFVPWLVFLLFIAAVIYALSSISYWAYLLDGNARSAAEGVVEEIRSAGRTPIYYDRVNGTFCTPSFISISGVDYYILTDEGIDVGQNISVVYCTEGNTVLEWRTTPPGFMSDTPVPNEQVASDADDIRPAGNRPFLTAPQMLMCFAVILAGLSVFDRPISRWRLEYFREHEIVVNGLVAARKPSIAACTMECVVTLFAVLSLLTQNVALIAVLWVLAVCLWGIYLCIQKTFIVYEDGQFTYSTISTQKTYRVSDVQKVCFVTTRYTGCLQLQIYFNKGSCIKLEQLHFEGLKPFYDWLTMYQPEEV